MKHHTNIFLTVLVSVFFVSLKASQRPSLIKSISADDFFTQRGHQRESSPTLEEWVMVEDSGQQYLTAKDVAIHSSKKAGITEAEIAENTMSENMGLNRSGVQEELLPIKGLTFARLNAMSDDQFALFSELIDFNTGQLMPFVGADTVRSVRCSNILCQRIVEPQKVSDCGWQSLKNAHEELSEVYRVPARILRPDGTVFHSAKELAALWKDGKYGGMNTTEVPLFMVTADLLPADEDDQMRLIESEGGLKNAYLAEIKTHLFKNEKGSCAVLVHTGSVQTQSGNDHWIIVTVVNTGKKIKAVVMDSIGFRNTAGLNLEVFNERLKGSVFNYNRLTYEPVINLLKELGIQ